MRGNVTLCYMVDGGTLNSPLNLFISFAKALMEQGFRSDLFLAKDTYAAGPGWDACTGWGTPNGGKLADALR